MTTSHHDVMMRLAELRGTLSGLAKEAAVSGAQLSRVLSGIAEASELAEQLPDVLTDARLDQIAATLPTVSANALDPVQSLLRDYSDTQILSMLADECSRRSIRAYGSTRKAAERGSVEDERQHAVDCAKWSERHSFWRRRRAI